MPGTSLLIRWCLACLVGEALGIAIVATAYAALDRGVLTDTTNVILTAGAWEGLALGTAQAFVLRRLGVDPFSWIVLTVAGAVTGYGLSIIGGAGSGEESPGAAEPALWLMALLGAGLGVVMGLLMGGLQGLAFRGIVTIRRWALANAVGWAPAMAVIIIAAGLPGYAWPLPAVALLGTASGAIAGLCVGAVTALALRNAEAMP